MYRYIVYGIWYMIYTKYVLNETYRDISRHIYVCHITPVPTEVQSFSARRQEARSLSYDSGQLG